MGGSCSFGRFSACASADPVALCETRAQNRFIPPILDSDWRLNWR